MSTFNRVILIGNLAADPETRSTKTGKKVTQFPLATDRNRKDENGEKTKTTDFHRIIAWGWQSDISEKYLKKGKKVFVDGRVNNRSYEDAQGQKRYVTEIVASHLELMSPSSNGKGSKDEEGEEIATELAEVKPAEFATA